MLIHGHPVDPALREPQVAALRGSFRALAPDLRGFGGGTGRPGRVLMWEYPADIGELLEELGIGRAAAGSP